MIRIPLEWKFRVRARGLGLCSPIVPLRTGGPAQCTQPAPQVLQRVRGQNVRPHAWVLGLPERQALARAWGLEDAARDPGPDLGSPVVGHSHPRMHPSPVPWGRDGVAPLTVKVKRLPRGAPGPSGLIL